MSIRLFNRGNVRCIDCGFLGRRWMFDAEGKPTESGMNYQRWGLIEMPAALRKPAAHDLNGRYGGLNCQKAVIDMSAFEGDDLIRSIEERRHCAWFERNADLSFEEHARARADRHEFQRRMWLDRGFFAGLAALVTVLITQVLPRLMGK